MFALTRCVSAGLCLVGLVLLTIATLFQPRADVSASAIAIWVVGSAALAGLACFSLKEMVKTFRAAQELGASLLFERQLQPKGLHLQELLYARKIVALSQRYGRPLSVVGISWAAAASQRSRVNDRDSVLRGLDQHLQRFRFLKILDEHLRSSDAVIPTQDTSRCFVVCPETTSDQALGFCSRVESILTAMSEDTVLAFTVAVFETDGYSLEELLERCDERLNNAPLTPSDIARDRIHRVAGVAAE
jgi:hypothetical protein